MICSQKFFQKKDIRYILQNLFILGSIKIFNKNICIKLRKEVIIRKEVIGLNRGYYFNEIYKKVIRKIFKLFLCDVYRCQRGYIFIKLILDLKL